MHSVHADRFVGVWVCVLYSRSDLQILTLIISTEIFRLPLHCDAV